VSLPGPGIYNVLWVNVSTVDGHELRGSYPFTVLKPDGTLPEGQNLVSTSGSEADPPPQPESVAVRALSILGLVLAVAGVLPALLAGGTARRWNLVALAGAALVLAIASGLQLSLLADTGDGRSLASVLTDTRLGRWWIARAAAAAFVAAAFLVRTTLRPMAAVALAGVAVYLTGYTATSHAAAGTGANWAMVSDYCHGFAAVGWMGGVVGLAVTARVAGGDGGYAPLMRRFGLFASAAVFVLIATGFVNSLILLGAFDDLWTTRYGLTLVAKMGMTVPLLGMAAFNARRGRRWLESGERRGARLFVRSALAEALLGGLVLFGGAMLTQSTVARNVFEQPESRPFEADVTMADLQVRLEIEPNHTGLNTYAVALADAAGNPVDADRVRLTFRYQEDQTVGASTLALAPSSDGRYTGAGPYLTLEGDWRVEVEVRRPDVDDVTAFFDVRPAGTVAGPSGVGGGWDNPAAALSWNEFAGILALVGGVGIVLFRNRLPARRRLLAWSANGSTVALFGVGMVLLFGVHGHTPAVGLPRNPIVPDTNSIQRGRTIYERNCAACHGRAGVPPEGLDLDPYPLDLTVHVPQHPDGQIFVFISQGLQGTAMRAWGSGEGSLEDDEIWHVVNFLRTLSEADE
jgi:putative copper export protein/mono/diheme cytochrome c family protein